MQLDDAFHLSNKTPRFTLPFFLDSSSLAKHAQLPFATKTAELFRAFPHLVPKVIEGENERVGMMVEMRSVEEDRDVISVEEEYYGDFYGNLPKLSDELVIIDTLSNESPRTLNELSPLTTPGSVINTILKEEVKSGEPVKVLMRNNATNTPKLVETEDIAENMLQEEVDNQSDSSVDTTAQANSFARVKNPYLKQDRKELVAEVKSIVRNSVVRIRKGGSVPINVTFEECEFIFE